MFRLMIDPGHTGQSDPGAVAGGVREADVVLDVALRLRDELAGTPGLEIRLTRESAADPVKPWSQAADLSWRARMANVWGANAYVSLHLNAAQNTEAHGVETYHHPDASPAARRAAQVIQRHLAPLFRRDRGVKAANYAVLRETRCPAVLVEMGFVTNPDDRKQLSNPSFRQKLAEALAAGIREAFNLPAPVRTSSATPAPTLQRPVEVVVGNKKVVGYLASDSRTWVPVREIAETLGYGVEWKDGVVTLKKGRK